MDLASHRTLGHDSQHRARAPVRPARPLQLEPDRVATERGRHDPRALTGTRAMRIPDRLTQTLLAWAVAVVGPAPALHAQTDTYPAIEGEIRITPFAGAGVQLESWKLRL